MKKQGFTLVELLVVIAIIGLIASLSVIALGNARQKSRDSKRVSDIKQVQTALELFFSDQGRYPTIAEWNTGSLYATSTITGTTTYMERIPTAQTGGACNNNYSYAPSSTGDNYTINFCLENSTGSLSSGFNLARAGFLGRDSSLMGLWQLDSINGAKDLSGGGRNGTSSGGVILGGVANQKGTPGGATYFDGVDDKIKTANLTSGTTYTFSAWIKPDSQADNYGAIYSNESVSGFYFKNNLRMSAYFSTDGSNNTLATNGAWNHYVCVVDSGSATFYLNGVVSGTRLNVFSIPFSSIGDDTSSETYKGSISELAIYNRVFSASEVLALYNATK